MERRMFRRGPVAPSKRFRNISETFPTKEKRFGNASETTSKRRRVFPGNISYQDETSPNRFRNVSGACFTKQNVSETLQKEFARVAPFRKRPRTRRNDSELLLKHFGNAPYKGEMLRQCFRDDLETLKHFWAHSLTRRNVFVLFPAHSGNMSCEEGAFRTCFRDASGSPKYQTLRWEFPGKFHASNGTRPENPTIQWASL